MKLINSFKTYEIIAFGSLLLLTLSETPRRAPHSPTKYYKSSLLHSLVVIANLTFSEANSESRSKSSRGGGGSSLKIGGNTAGSKPRRGVSNWGGINVSYLCSTLSFS